MELSKSPRLKILSLSFAEGTKMQQGKVVTSRGKNQQLLLESYMLACTLYIFLDLFFHYSASLHKEAMVDIDGLKAPLDLEEHL